MSKTRIEMAECPQCGLEQKVKIWDSIEVDQNPEAKEEILKNRLFLFKCESCGFEAPQVQTCLYHDSDKELLVFMVPDYDFEKSVKIRFFMKEMGNILPEYKKDSYECRIVSNINQMKEKIMIRDEELDDRIIELMKLHYISQVKKTLDSGAFLEAFFDSSNEQNGFVFFFEDRNPMFGEMNIEAYNILLEDFMTEAERLTPEGFAEIDLKWAEMLASKE